MTGLNDEIEASKLKTKPREELFPLTEDAAHNFTRLFVYRLESKWKHPAADLEDPVRAELFLNLDVDEVDLRNPGNTYLLSSTQSMARTVLKKHSLEASQHVD